MTDKRAIETDFPAASSHASAYAPNAAALGDYGDFPMPFAILRVVLSDDGSSAVDTRFVYANDEYCQAISREAETLKGRSYLQIYDVEAHDWLDRCYRAAVLGEIIRGFCYDPIVRGWTCTKLVPSKLENCCILVVDRVPIDDEQRRQLMSSADARTSYYISEMLSALAVEQSYEHAMNGILKMLKSIMQADRLGIFVCSGNRTQLSFELCEEGVEPQLGSDFPLPKDVLAYWFHTVTTNRVVLVPDISIIQRMSPALHKWCLDSGVKSLLAVPFFNDGEIVGFLGAYNYQIDETIDLDRFFEAVSSFIAARLDNLQLIESLSYAGTHDALTNVLNRRGARDAMTSLIENDPHGRYVLALFDLDDFKRVNDVYGHTAGDAALLALANTLNETFPRNAIISRNGGDEFLVLLSGEAALNVSASLAQLTEKGVVFDIEGTEHRITISVGYARYPEQANDLHELFTKADIALYAVKMSGKAGFGKYTSEAEASLRPQLGFSTHDLLESVPYPLIICRAEKDDDLLFVSNSAAQTLGYLNRFDLLQAPESTFASIVDESDREQVINLLKATSEERQMTPVSFDFKARCKDGSTKRIHANACIIAIEEIGSATYIMLSQDIPHAAESTNDTQEER